MNFIKTNNGIKVYAEGFTKELLIGTYADMIYIGKIKYHEISRKYMFCGKLNVLFFDEDSLFDIALKLRELNERN